jgi:hypothetical protein
MDDIVDYISEDSPYAHVNGTTAIPTFFFAVDITFSSFTANGLLKATDQVTKHCRERNLKWNLKKTEILVFKKGGKLKKDERWTVNDKEN